MTSSKISEKRVIRSYPNPVTAVFLRVLAWELYVAQRKLKVKDATKEQLQIARKELGLDPFNEAGGGGHDFIQKLRKGDNPLLSPKNTAPKPIEKYWEKEWRLLHLPSHSSVRQLSDIPIVKFESSISATQNFVEMLVMLRNPSLPKVRITIGGGVDGISTLKDRRGVYFMRLENSLYIGQSNEFHTRFGGHSSKHKKTEQETIQWWFFVSQEEIIESLTQETINATESLLISFWNEVAIISNGNRGKDTKPSFHFLQQSILFTMAAAAALIWAIRDDDLSKTIECLGIAKWDIPFKKLKGVSMADSYMSVPI